MGRQVQAVEHGVRPLGDGGLARFELDDQSVLRVKPVVLSILELVGEKDDLGEPVYIAQCMVHLSKEGESDDDAD
jgi:hypothetical protein